jgi:GWxTD domain-containing protein
LPKTIIVVFILILCTDFSSLWAQYRNESDFELHIDYARFQGEQNLIFVEIYYAFSRDSIAHIPEDDQFIASYNTKLEVSVNDSVLKTMEWKSQDALNSLTDLKPNQIINDVYGLLLGKGNFKIKLEVTDLLEQKISSNQIMVLIDPPQSDSLWISDIQFGLKIDRSQQKNRFVKNGLSIVPNPSNIYTPNWPVLYYYFEIYNLKNPNHKSDARYNIIANVKDISGKIIKEIPAKSKNIDNESVVEVNKTLVSSLKSGVYNLTIELVNLATEERVAKNKQFYVYRTADYAQSESDHTEKKDKLYLIFLTKSEEELDREFEFTTYMTSSDEEDVYEELNLEGKRKFLASFWDLKNLFVGKSAQLFRQEYLDRVQIANERYSVSGKEGWRTARGRIILVYGLPDDIEKFYGGPGAKQHETWTFHALDGGAIFVFVDISGYGNYQLVHSTAKDEIYDMNWRDKYIR